MVRIVLTRVLVLGLGWLVGCSYPETAYDETGVAADDGSEDTSNDSASSAVLGSTDDGATTDEPSDSTDTTEPPLECSFAHACAGVSATDGLVIFELGTGMVLDSIPLPNLSSGEMHSIAWTDDGVHVCGGDPPSLHQIDVATGAIIDGGLPCMGVTDVQGELLVRRATTDVLMPEYARYPDFAAAMADMPSSETSYPLTVERFTATDDVLVGAWHATAELEVFDLATAAPLAVLPLEGHDDWVMGMEVVDGQLVIGTWFSHAMRHLAFDPITGARTCELPSMGYPLDGIEGLACRSEPL